MTGQKLPRQHRRFKWCRCSRVWLNVARADISVISVTTVAGKTGTTNDNTNGWFIGFTPDLVVGVFVGYDLPRPLGKSETGSTVAVPIFGDFMTRSQIDKPVIRFVDE